MAGGLLPLTQGLVQPVVGAMARMVAQVAALALLAAAQMVPVVRTARLDLTVLAPQAARPVLRAAAELRAHTALLGQQGRSVARQVPVLQQRPLPVRGLLMRLQVLQDLP